MKKINKRTLLVCFLLVCGIFYFVFFWYKTHRGHANLANLLNGKTASKLKWVEIYRPSYSIHQTYTNHFATYTKNKNAPEFVEVYDELTRIRKKIANSKSNSTINEVFQLRGKSIVETIEQKTIEAVRVAETGRSGYITFGFHDGSYYKVQCFLNEDAIVLCMPNGTEHGWPTHRISFQGSSNAEKSIRIILESCLGQWKW